MNEMHAVKSLIICADNLVEPLGQEITLSGERYPDIPSSSNFPHINTADLTYR